MAFEAAALYRWSAGHTLLLVALSSKSTVADTYQALAHVADVMITTPAGETRAMAV